MQLEKNRPSEAGFVVSFEVVLIATVFVCGLITGWVKLRDQSLAEIKDSIAAIDTYINGVAPIFQPYAQPYIVGGAVTSAAVAPVTDEYTGPPCVATSGAPVDCTGAYTTTVPGGTLTLEYGPQPTGAKSGSPLTFEATTF